jgi:hypothetical protein
MNASPASNSLSNPVLSVTVMTPLITTLSSWGAAVNGFGLMREANVASRNSAGHASKDDFRSVLIVLVFISDYQIV